MNYTTTEIAKKYGDVIVNSPFEDIKNAHKSIKDFVQPFMGCWEQPEHIIRNNIFKALDNKEIIPNVSAAAVPWSRDGKTVQLYRGMTKGMDNRECMSWTLQPASAVFFYLQNRLKDPSLTTPLPKEVRVMTIPLDKLDEFCIWYAQAHYEVIVDTRSPLFKQYFKESESLDAEEARIRGYYYRDKRYGVPCDIPTPYLSQWNEYPFNLIYPPYTPDTTYKGGRWCYETLTMIEE